VRVQIDRDIRTSTVKKELEQFGAYGALTMTVGETAIGGSAIVVIARKRL
jgi:hypothetical protein